MIDKKVLIRDDTISRQGLKESLLSEDYEKHEYCFPCKEIMKRIDGQPSAQPETCEGCKHLGKWENEVEYGYPSPCTRCKRRVEDHYER